MQFSLEMDVSILTVFLQGIISFFSPCVLPLLPIYIGYLSGGTSSVGEDGRVYYKRSKVMLNTVFFVIGVSFTFLILGLGMTAVGGFFNSKQVIFSRISGILVFCFGLYQLGVFGKSSVLEKEHRLPLRLNTMAMSPITALIMGFSFSFAWTPCVGPTLASVLIMVASASTKLVGIMLIGVYTLGFILPFLVVGLFTTSLLDFFKKHNQIVKYTVKIGGILMLIMGVFMFTGKMNSVTGYLSNISSSNQKEDEENMQSQDSDEEIASSKSDSETEVETGEEDMSEKVVSSTEEEAKQEEKRDTSDSEDETEQEIEEEAGSEDEEETDQEKEEQDEEQLYPAIDFTLKDQYGNTHTLSDYKGKTVFLNFWATWCPPCRAEMPDIQKIYESYKEEGDDSLVILGVAEPNQGKEKTKQGVINFLEENGYTYPVLMDTTGEQFMNYGVYTLPTTYMIDKDGNVFGYVSGQIDEETMRSIIKQTMEGKR